MRYFTAVVDCGSFTEAAERCYISQSAISQQIQALEKELGVELLRRENRRFAMTAAGESFYVRSKAILEQADAMVQEVKRLGADRELRLRIGYLRGYSGLELHQAVAEFSRRYPEVAISIVNGTHEELYNLLRLDGADLVFNDQRRAFSDAYVNDELAQCGLWAEVSLPPRSPGRLGPGRRGGAAGDALHPDLLPGGAERGAGVLPEHIGLRRQLPLCGQPGGGPPAGGGQPGLPAG